MGKIVSILAIFFLSYFFDSLHQLQYRCRDNCDCSFSTMVWKANFSRVRTSAGFFEVSKLCAQISGGDQGKSIDNCTNLG